MVEQLIIAGIVLTSVAFVGRRAWRALAAARAPKSGCGTDCGCASSTPSSLKH